MSYQLGLYDESFEKDACGIGLIFNAVKGPQHEIVENGLEILSGLAHRSALGADGLTSDGAGVMVQIPDQFFREEFDFGHELPAQGQYAVAQIFSPPGFFESGNRAQFEKGASRFGLQVLVIRKVPVCSHVLGPQAKQTEPETYQVILKPQQSQDPDQKKKVFLFKKWAEAHFRKYSGCRDPETGETLSQFYICSLSFETLIYKGLMQPKDLGVYYPDLKNPKVLSQFAMVHSRFSTNTLPAWELAQPFRFCCHNGEINTIRGNRNWMKARTSQFWHSLGLLENGPLLTDNRSDSTNLDEALELLLLKGYALPHAMMMLIPEPWEEPGRVDKKLKDFYQFHSLRMEPWDGPAALCFSEGPWIGARLDRNGLRPFRYEQLVDGTFIGGSEAGILDIPQSQILKKGRLKPGQVLIAHLHTGEIDLDDHFKSQLAQAKNYSELLEKELIKPNPSVFSEFLKRKTDFKTWLRFGYHYDEIQRVLLPMLVDAEEVTSSMGADTALALLSDSPQLLYRYFRQMFAQVTNPPIDPIREKSVMSLQTFLGPRASPFEQGTDQKKRMLLSQPLIQIQQISNFKSEVLDGTFDLKAETLQERLQLLCRQAECHAQMGTEILILSDRKSTAERAAIPALLLVSAIHTYLLQKQHRMEISLVIETAEARDVHQMACLLSFGVDAIDPYLVSDLIWELDQEKLLPLGLEPQRAYGNYLQAIQKGLLKILSKLGISTLQSYKGAQTFEILGLSESVVGTYFPGTPSRIGGLTLDQMAEEVRRRWERANLENGKTLWDLPARGDIHYNSKGEPHHWNPVTISKLQIATRNKDLKTYQEYSEALKEADQGTLRAYLKFRKSENSIPLEKVEPAKEIVRRFTTGAMSLGALGSEAHETLAIAMNRLNGKSNSGEGGEDPRRSTPLENGDSKNSAIKQIASARFGVTTDYLTSAKELQIKMAQGAKPGEGGQLPGPKVNEEIARIRHSTPGVTLISPPPHHDIYSIEDLAQLIFDLKAVNPEAVVSVKLVSEAGVGTVAAGVAKANAGKILISGDGGGTGASPLSSIQFAGVPWELGLAETHQTLLMNGLRSRVRLEADGQLRTGRDVALAALLGADEFGFATAPLIVEGCIMMRKCHLNTCPVGVATQDPELRKKFSGKPEHLINYFFFVAEELRLIMAGLGISRVEEMIGRRDLLQFEAPLQHWKGKSMDLSKLLFEFQDLAFSSMNSQEKNNFSHTDQKLQMQTTATVTNRDRAVGTWLSGELSRKKKQTGFRESRELLLTGSAGQSLGAFLAEGITLKLVGEANDYVGKGLSGGKLVVRFDPHFGADSWKSALVGNTCLYGATSGKAFIAGCAGERFAVRNSGAVAVVEGVGDHGCEYMTGGCVVVLGTPGYNFAAGMSGGVAYIYDEEGMFRLRCNKSLVEVESLKNKKDEAYLYDLILEHEKETSSRRAFLILSNWQNQKRYFRKVIPTEYRKVLELQKRKFLIPKVNSDFAFMENQLA